MTTVCDQDTSDSEGSCALIGQSRSSLSSALSTDSLRGELLLPDLLIQEDEEEERRKEGADRSREAQGPPDGELGWCVLTNSIQPL